MPARIIPNVSKSLENHLRGYAPYMSKPHYQHFKDAIVGIAEGASSLAGLSRSSGTPERTWWHFFNESMFDDVALLTQSASVMNNHTETRSTNNSFVILDFTSVFKTGEGFEWADFLWNEETDTRDGVGHEQVIALEHDPTKDYHKCLGMRRYYHDDKLYETEYTRDDFEKKPVTVSMLLSKVQSTTQAREILVDGEFIHAFLVNHFERLGFAWTGRIKKSLLVTYEGKRWHLEPLVTHLLKERSVSWREATYRNQKISTFALTINVDSLAKREVTIAVCKNKRGNLAFIGTSILNRKAEEIVRIYSYRWEIEVFFKEMKGNLSFGDYRMRSVAANSRWQIFTLIAANLLELIRKTKIEKMLPVFPWFKKAVNRLYQTAQITVGITISLLRDLRHGGENLIRCL
jgi:hypothetical protein